MCAQSGACVLDFREAARPEPRQQKPAESGGLCLPAGAGEIRSSGDNELSRLQQKSQERFLPQARCARCTPLPAGCFRSPREAFVLSISAVLPGFPGLFSPQSRAPWPVWRNSVAGPVRFAPMSRKQAARLWHKARRWDGETRQPGRHGGIIGRTALGTLYVLLFDFLNHRTGRLDPSLDAIAAKAGCCRRAVVDALARLRDLGLLAWHRRCEETRDAEGRFRLRQRTNAYGL